MEQRNQQSFDQFFQEHRQQLDVEIPGAHVWKEVEARLDGKTIPLWSRLPLWRAAAVLLMVVAGAAALWQLRPEIELTKDGVADIPALTHQEHQHNWASEEATYVQKEDSLLREIQHFELYQHPEAEAYMQQIQALNAQLADGHMEEKNGEESLDYELLRELHKEKLSLLSQLLSTLKQD